MRCLCACGLEAAAAARVELRWQFQPLLHAAAHRRFPGAAPGRRPAARSRERVHGPPLGPRTAAMIWAVGKALTRLSFRRARWDFLSPPPLFLTWGGRGWGGSGMPALQSAASRSLSAPGAASRVSYRLSLWERGRAGGAERCRLRARSRVSTRNFRARSEGEREVTMSVFGTCIAGGGSCSQEGVKNASRPIFPKAGKGEIVCKAPPARISTAILEARDAHCGLEVF